MILLLFLLVVPPVLRDYKVQIGDKIVVTVSGSINFTYSQVISPEGSIFIQSGGLPLWSPEKEEVVPSGATILEVAKIVGLSLEEAERLIMEKFNKYFKDINVTITLVEFKDVVYVQGAVVAPQAYPFFPGKTARDYIGLAGGPLPSANLKELKIITPDKKVINRDLDAVPPRNSVIDVPQSTVYGFRDYLTILSSVVSVVYLVTMIWAR